MDYCFLLAEDPGDHNSWTSLAYTCQELVDGVLDHIRDRGPSLKHKFQSRELNSIYWPVDKNGQYKSEERLLKDYWDMFNELFFSNALTPTRSHWRLIERDDLLWNGVRRHGETDDCRLDFELYDDPELFRREVDAVIFIYKDLQGHPMERLRIYIQTLLHEMIHAFIQIYACFCSRCKTKYEDQEGKTGHGQAWQSIAYEIEIFVRNELGLDLDLNRVISIAEELYKCRVDVSCGYLSTFNVDEDKLADELAKQYSQERDILSRNFNGENSVQDPFPMKSYFSSDDSSNGEHDTDSSDDSHTSKNHSKHHDSSSILDGSSSSKYDDCSNTNPVEESSQELDGAEI
ncbi:hypothetical protein L207DRAFT_585289 [Hyaloscypha variabilis F]|uniref:SprT-like domain-containing protein n=1 Tax=Hyaloscypha variabilis (strain UAMH 11265 / GT02V1 / F) TaxID=1149755 RepID=A0A2J6RIS1_HYAVF|nr:hypothetical protein L207DRAFT_585289 [Hyaloscypha variabilis F]